MDTNSPHPAPRVAEILSAISHHPRRILALWNWKSALLSTILRAPIFLSAALSRGWRAALSAVFAESIFCALSAGFYGAIVQSLKDAEPQWLTGMFLAVVLPILFQAMEYVLHWFRGTPHLRIAAIVSLIVSGLSALFNWYAMRQGTLLVGGEGGSLGSDMRRMPRILFEFLVLVPHRLARNAKKNFSNLFAAPRPDSFSWELTTSNEDPAPDERMA